MSNSESSKPARRKRLPWTETEVQHLNAGILQYGLGNWSKILNDPVHAGAFMPQRIPQDLKDKYRVLLNNYFNHPADPASPSLKKPQKRSHDGNSAPRSSYSADYNQPLFPDELVVNLFNLHINDTSLELSSHNPSHSSPVFPVPRYPAPESPNQDLVFSFHALQPDLHNPSSSSSLYTPCVSPLRWVISPTREPDSESSVSTNCLVLNHSLYQNYLNIMVETLYDALKHVRVYKSQHPTLFNRNNKYHNNNQRFLYVDNHPTFLNKFKGSPPPQITYYNHFSPSSSPRSPVLQSSSLFNEDDIRMAMRQLDPHTLSVFQDALCNRRFSQHSDMLLDSNPSVFNDPEEIILFFIKTIKGRSQNSPEFQIFMKLLMCLGDRVADLIADKCVKDPSRVLMWVRPTPEMFEDLKNGIDQFHALFE